ncbi:Gfo/Idh/MocA family protein [Deinococcus oregonensis]|uniref:Gfo/Idh/MocA family protein n=1 Tax=Deinococcus oregonensis TaxID=1805970 RepID=A0ABV6AWY5_9DEIO
MTVQPPEPLQPVNLAVVGCGVIATPYAQGMQSYPALRLYGCFDVDPERARAYAEQQGCLAFESLEALLADPAVEIVVNLTVLPAHYAVTRQALEAGKHVFSEKPLASSSAQAQELVTLARTLGVRLACAPVTILGGAQQRALQELRAGRIGPVRVIYAEANHGRIESWHPVPQSFYGVGPLRDVGVYPLGIVTSIFGPASRVWAYGQAVKPQRVTKRGQPFEVSENDFYVALIEFASGPVLRLTASFYTTDKGKQTGIEFQGDDGQLYLSSWMAPDAALEVAQFGAVYEPLPDYTPAPQGWNWALALDDLARSLRENRPHRVPGEQAAHIVEILEAAHTSIREGKKVEVHSTFPAVAPALGQP